jgi:hypothetical protein
MYALDTLRSPAELWSITKEGGDPKPVTKRNEAKVRAARMGDYEPFAFVGAKNDRVMGFIVKPADFQEGKRYPVAFLIHGGPQGSFGDHFHYRWNPQAYAGAGYAAVMIDFHGSTGYGQAFTDAINGDWGGAPYDVCSSNAIALATSCVGQLASTHVSPRSSVKKSVVWPFRERMEATMRPVAGTRANVRANASSGTSPNEKPRGSQTGQSSISSKTPHGTHRERAPRSLPRWISCASCASPRAGSASAPSRPSTSWVVSVVRMRRSDMVALSRAARTRVG